VLAVSCILRAHAAHRLQRRAGANATRRDGALVLALSHAPSTNAFFGDLFFRYSVVTASPSPPPRCPWMAISVSAAAPAGDAPVKFPDTRRAKQPLLEKKRETGGEDNANSNLLQARALATRRGVQPAPPLQSPLTRASLAAGGCDCHLPGRQVDVVVAQVAQAEGRGRRVRCAAPKQAFSQRGLGLVLS
jgi:hypothetical protein